MDAVAGGNDSVVPIAIAGIFLFGADRQNIRFSQLDVRRIFATRNVDDPVSLSGVPIVVGLGAQVEMAGIAAPLHVTSMQNVTRWFVHSMRQPISDDVRSQDFAAETELSISVRADTPRPKPTVEKIAPINSGPERVSQCFVPWMPSHSRFLNPDFGCVKQ